MRLAIVPRGRWGRLRVIALVSLLPLLVLVIWMVTVKMPGPAFHGPLPPLTLQQEAVRQILLQHVHVLAGEIGERSDRRYDNVRRAAAYIEAQLAALGYAVLSQEFTAQGRPYRNLEATLGGTSRPHEVVILGAHYDTAEDAPGADDNASGVAAVLALARGFARERQARTLRFVFFPNEEPPSFGTADMGSRH
ncbi:MAG: M20/M25/M40 family metallo-hydrolase, partial [Gemmatimonadales bacterium]